jgi:hypothetical protein
MNYLWSDLSTASANSFDASGPIPFIISPSCSTDLPVYVAPFLIIFSGSLQVAFLPFKSPAFANIIGARQIAPRVLPCSTATDKKSHITGHTFNL